MRVARKHCSLFLILFLLGGLLAAEAYCQLSSGQPAPVFSLKDVKGQDFDFSRMKERPLTVLYFFDAESKPSQEGLMSLNKLTKDHKGLDLAVWAITLSTKEKVNPFVSRSGLVFPVLLDGSGVSDSYRAPHGSAHGDYRRTGPQDPRFLSGRGKDHGSDARAAG